MRNGPAETQNEKTCEDRRQYIGERRRRMGQMFTEAGDQARVVQGFTEGGETADQPQRAEGLMPQDVQGAMTMRAIEQGKRDDADRRETGTDHQRISQHHGQAFAQ
ncbi:hypothetical protein EMIT0180MI3_360036 [Priestia megaterium]